MADVLDRREVYLRAQALVSRVYALPEAERDPYVERETQADPRLRDEVRWLLEALAGPDDDFLEVPATAEVPDENPELKVPTPRNYTLIRPLGEGGMGVVYLAERVEGDLKQVVALKLLNLVAMLNPMVVNRFLTERQLLAKLNHPNIARLIDAGALADGRPFLAMEYVEGTELDRYCEDHQLGIAERLKLFVKVCQAVQYAHQHLIIHRDLKPANVLVTEDGEPKLVDFGIARLWSSGDVATQTVGAERIMTLAYASPEQLAGKPLTTATDVYSLGIMLYELLAGERPWGAATEPLALAREIGKSEPLPPSAMRRQTRARAEADRRGLKGFRWRLPNDLPKDLDAIVLKALRLDPDERYASALALADDLHRFQTNRPVKAREGQAWYRTRKYLRRNWIPLTVSAGIVAMTAAYIADRQMQLDRTERERAKVQQVRDFLVGLFKEVQPAYTQGQNISAKEMLDRGTKRLEAAPPADPNTQVALLIVVSDIYHQLGDFNTAARTGYLAIKAGEGAFDDAAARWQSVLVTASAESSRGNHKAAENLVRRAVESPEAASIPPQIKARLLNLLSVTLFQQGGNFADIESFARQAIALLEPVSPQSPDLVFYRASLGIMLLARGETAKGLALLERAAAIAPDIFGPEHPHTLNTLSGYGLALREDSQTAKALPTLRRAYEGQARILGPGHFNTQTTGGRIGLALMDEERWAEAEPLLRARLAATEATMGRVNRPAFNANLNLAATLAGLGRYTEAEALGRAAVRIAQEAFSGPTQIGKQAQANNCLAEILVALNRSGEAKSLAEKTIGDLRGQEKTEFDALSNAHFILGAVAGRQFDTQGAAAEYRRALELNPRNRNASIALGKALTDLGRFDEAETVLARTVETLQANASSGAPSLARANQALDDLRTRSGKTRRPPSAAKP